MIRMPRYLNPRLLSSPLSLCKFMLNFFLIFRFRHLSLSQADSGAGAPAAPSSQSDVECKEGSGTDPPAAGSEPADGVDAAGSAAAVPDGSVDPVSASDAVGPSECAVTDAVAAVGASDACAGDTDAVPPENASDVMAGMGLSPFSSSGSAVVQEGKEEREEEPPLPPGWGSFRGVRLPPPLPSTGLGKSHVLSLLAAFTAPEALRIASGNGYMCEACGLAAAVSASAPAPAAPVAASAAGGAGAPVPSPALPSLPSVRRDASRRLLLYSPPRVLTLHIKACSPV